MLLMQEKEANVWSHEHARKKEVFTHSEATASAVPTHYAHSHTLILVMTCAMQVLSFTTSCAVEAAGAQLAFSAAGHPAAYRTAQQQDAALGSMAAALMGQLNRLHWCTDQQTLTREAAARYHSLLCHIVDQQRTRMLGLLPASVAAALATMGSLTSEALQQLGPSLASEVAQQAGAVATFWLTQACDTADQALPLAACAAVLAAAAECCSEPISRSAALQRTMDLYVGVLRRCTRLLLKPPAGSDAHSRACLAAAAASMAGLVANSALQLLNRRCARRLGGDPALWLTQHDVLRCLTASLPLLVPEPQQPPEPRQPAAEPAPHRPVPAGQRPAPPPPPPHLQSLWDQQQQQQQRDAAAAARLAQLQRGSLQAAVNALYAVLGWAEAAWHAEPADTPAAPLTEQLAAAATAIVAMAQQLEKHNLQRQQAELPERDAAAQAASQRRSRQHGKKQPLLLQAPSGKGSQDPAQLAWHLRAAITAADSVSCLVRMVSEPATVLQLSPAAPCIVHTLTLLAGASDTAAASAAAELLGSACHALATFAATDEAVCKALAAGDGQASWRQVFLHVASALQLLVCSSTTRASEWLPCFLRLYARHNIKDHWLTVHNRANACPCVGRGHGSAVRRARRCRIGWGRQKCRSTARRCSWCRRHWQHLQTKMVPLMAMRRCDTMQAVAPSRLLLANFSGLLMSWKCVPYF